MPSIARDIAYYRSNVPEQKIARVFLYKLPFLNRKEASMKKRSGLKKSPRDALAINYGGKIYSRRHNCDVFADVLHDIGLERVAELGVQLNGQPLVSRDAVNYRAPKHRDGWHIETHYSTVTKVGLLTQIKQKLALDMELLTGSDAYRAVLLAD
jgi:hypothetical protein